MLPKSLVIFVMVIAALNVWYWMRRWDMTKEQRRAEDIEDGWRR